MTAELESGALEQVARSYDVGEGAQTTQLDDGNISQVLPINEMNRRSRAPFASQGSKGLMVALLQNGHSVAGELQSFVMPYDPVNTHNGYPSPIDPRQFDIWLLGASSRCNAGTGALVTFGLLGIDVPASLFSMSALASGGPVAIAEQEQFLTGWGNYAGFPTVAGDVGSAGGAVANPASVWTPLHMRLPTDQELVFRSEVTAATTVFCLVQLGIFPAAVGQDAY